LGLIRQAKLQEVITHQLVEIADYRIVSVKELRIRGLEIG
jgi:hypothetical protein